MSDYVVSHIRTIVPIIVGWVVVLLANAGIDIDSTEAVSAITAGAIGLYYAIVRAAAQKWPAAGWLLGYQKAPTYSE